jgi:hypothetical protein
MAAAIACVVVGVKDVVAAGGCVRGYAPRGTPAFAFVDVDGVAVDRFDASSRCSASSRHGRDDANAAAAGPGEVGDERRRAHRAVRTRDTAGEHHADEAGAAVRSSAPWSVPPRSRSTPREE